MSTLIGCRVVGFLPVGCPVRVGENVGLDGPEDMAGRRRQLLVIERKHANI